MANILPRDLPAAGTIPSDTAIIIDNGVDVQKATPAGLVDAGAPVASAPEAEAGADNSKRMTALRTKQSILARALTVPDGEPISPLPAAASRVGGKALGFDDATGEVEVFDKSQMVNTFTTLATFKAQPVSNNNANLVGASGIADGSFNWETANAPYTADDINIVYSDSDPTGAFGAWVRQVATSVAFKSAGSSLLLRNSSEAVQSKGVNVLDYGYRADAEFAGGDINDPANWTGTDNTDAIIEAIAQAVAAGVSAIEIPPGTGLFSEPFIDGVLAPGLTFRGVGPNGYFNSTGAGDAIAARMLYSGADTAAKITSPYGSPPEATTTLNLTFENLSLGCIQRSASFFDFNDATGAHVTNPASSPYSVLMGFTMRNVRMIKDGEPTTSNTGDFIRANKLFQIKGDTSCYVSGWRRGLWLRCCDVSEIDIGRFELNGRHVQLEKYGTFGNDVVVRTTFLGPLRSGHAESPYCVYDMAAGTVIEAAETEAELSDALFYYGGEGTHVKSGTWLAAPMFELAPTGKNVIIDAPLIYADSGVTPIIQPPASNDFGASSTNYSAIIRSASTRARKAIGVNPRITYDGAVNSAGYVSNKELMRFDERGMRPKGAEFSIRNPPRSNTLGTIASGGITEWIEDSEAFNGWLWRLASATPQSGVVVSLTCGIDLMPGDRMAVKARIKTTNTVPGGWGCIILYNGVFGGVPLDLPESTSGMELAEGIVDFGVAIPAMDYGDSVQFVIYNVAADGDLYGEFLSYELLPPADALATTTLPDVTGNPADLAAAASKADVNARLDTIEAALNNLRTFVLGAEL